MLYSFEKLLELESLGEVSSSVVDSVRSELQSIITDGEWYDCEFETWKSALASVGLMDIEINFSGFCCKGDGASFVTGWIDKSLLINFFSTSFEASESIGVVDGKEYFIPWLVHKANGYRYNPAFSKLAYIQDWIDIKISRCWGAGNYSHESTCEVDFWFRGKHDSRVGRLAESFRDAVEEFRYDISRAIYRDLEEQYEALCEDSNLIDYCDANDLMFSEDGSLEFLVR